MFGSFFFFFSFTAILWSLLGLWLSDLCYLIHTCPVYAAGGCHSNQIMQFILVRLLSMFSEEFSFNKYVLLFIYFSFELITGGYDMEEKAARAYDLAALKYWGSSTHINFPVCKLGSTLGVYYQFEEDFSS